MAVMIFILNLTYLFAINLPFFFFSFHHNGIPFLFAISSGTDVWFLKQFLGGNIILTQLIIHGIHYFIILSSFSISVDTIIDPHWSAIIALDNQSIIFFSSVPLTPFRSYLLVFFYRSFSSKNN